MANREVHVFERSGIAALSDLQSHESKAIYSLLEKDCTFQKIDYQAASFISL